MPIQDQIKNKNRFFLKQNMSFFISKLMKPDGLTKCGSTYY